MSLKSFLLDCVKVMFGIFLGMYVFSKKQEIEIPKIEYIETIKYDSIYILNDSIITKIQYIEKQYEETLDSIINGPDSIQFEFFSNYVHNYSRRVNVN